MAALTGEGTVDDNNLCGRSRTRRKANAIPHRVTMDPECVTRTRVAHRFRTAIRRVQQRQTSISH